MDPKPGGRIIRVGPGRDLAAILPFARPNVRLADTASASRGRSCPTGRLPLHPLALGNFGVGAILGPGFWPWIEHYRGNSPSEGAKESNFGFEEFNITTSFHPGPGLSTGAANTFGG